MAHNVAAFVLSRHDRRARVSPKSHPMNTRASLTGATEADGAQARTRAGPHRRTRRSI